MSYPLDTAAQDAALDALLGTGLPASFEVAIFDDDPSNRGSELTGTGGVARAVVTNDSSLFPSSASGNQKSTVPIVFGDASGDWAAAGTYWAFYDHAGSTTGWWFGPLSDPLLVYSTTTAITIQATAAWNTF